MSGTDSMGMRPPPFLYINTQMGGRGSAVTIESHRGRVVSFIPAPELLRVPLPFLDAHWISPSSLSTDLLTAPWRLCRGTCVGPRLK